MEIHPLIFHRLPQPLEEHIIPRGSAPVHAEVTPPILDRLHKCLRGELAALIGIYNLWLAMLRERLVQHRKGMAGLHRDRDRRG